jgi:hypothetical protein
MNISEFMQYFLSAPKGILTKRVCPSITGFDVRATQNQALIGFQINNFTALSVEILDNVRPRTPYSDFSLWSR